MSLEKARAQIDQIDNQIVSLLRQRGDVAQQIGRIKGASGQAVHDPAREAQLLARLTQGELSPLDKTAIETIYRQIIAASRNLQRPVQVAFLGPKYTFSHVAALQYFGPGAQLSTLSAIEEVFSAVEQQSADYGIVPIENSIQGVEARTLDCLYETSLCICAESYVPIHLHLLANCKIDEIQVLHSHPQPLGQCRRWLRANLPNVRLVNESSTAAAARAIADQPQHAAIAAAEAAPAYELKVLASNIEDDPNNRTRFLVIGHHSVVPSGVDKTSIVFTTEHRAGALYRALASFSAHGLNLTLIQSRPARGAVAGYYFYVDLYGHADSVEVSEAVEALRAHCSFVKILGSYPSAD
jgi:chorismate mutase/prephenate dehydratase